MQDPWSLVAVVLLAVLAGAAVPVLFQLYATLGEARGLLRRAGPKLEAALADLGEATRRINAATAGLDSTAQRARGLLDAAGDLGESLHRLNRSLKPAVAIGGALGPALVVAIQAFLERQRAAANPGGADADPPAAARDSDQDLEQGDE